MPPPKQKPTAPILPVQSGRAFSHFAAATKSSVIFLPSTWRNFTAPFSSSPGIAADRRQAVRRERDEVGERRGAARRLRCTGFRPRFSWMTITPGSLPLAFAGRAR